MSESRLAIGVIGAGRIGKIHAESLATRIPAVGPSGRRGEDEGRAQRGKHARFPGPGHVRSLR